MRIALYVLLCILWIPLYLLGVIFYLIPVYRSRGKVSGTTYEPFGSRLLYHLHGGRPDPAALQLARGLPVTNGLVMATIFYPMVWASRITGYMPEMLQYPLTDFSKFTSIIAARTQFLDTALDECIETGDQIVILGAGWDTRAYGMLRDKQVNIFEVDAPATQAVKRAALEKSGIDAAHVCFVSCDFNQNSWLDALKANDFSQQQRSFILWEGVTMYLEESTIIDTFKMVASLAPGSRIACDFFTREWMEGTKLGKASARSISTTYGEPWIFGMPHQPDLESALGEYLNKCGLTLERKLVVGVETDGEVPVGGVLLAKTPA